MVGWREWLSLPELGIYQVKAKVDTGARTSALHAFDLEYFKQEDHLMVYFRVHPIQRDTSFTIEATAPVLDQRDIRNSSGGTQHRPVIRTYASLGAQRWPIELTLANRDVMGFRMLLGREAVRNRFVVDPGSSYLMSPSDSLAHQRYSGG
ncbi:MAG: RimK/LysX family protein [Cyanobacteria bacterium P01_F01_bin.86]